MPRFRRRLRVLREPTGAVGVVAQVAEPDVLELRVHGVANTPPAQMLGLLPGEVTQVDGDDVGSFWAATPQADAIVRPPGDPRHVPAGVRREAYSWGAMARLASVPGLGGVSGIVGGVVRALWVLIIPFGFANVAYWTRDADEPRGRRSSASGGLVRLFGLLLTLLWVASATAVTVGVVAAQCYGPRTDAVVEVPGQDPQTVTYVMTCSALPSALDSWARWTSGGRTAALLGVTALAVLVLGAVGSTGRLKYERRVSTTKAAGLANRTGPAWPMLARPGFWSHARRSSRLWYQHLTGAFALLTLVPAWHFLYRDVPGCQDAAGFGARGCLGAWDDDRTGWVVMVVGALVLLALTAWRVARFRVEPGTGDVLGQGAPTRAQPAPPTSEPPIAPAPPVTGERAPTRDRPSRLVEPLALAAALALLAWCLVATATSGDAPLRSQDPAVSPVLGLAGLPAALVAGLVLLSVVAIGARARVPAALWAPSVVVALLAAAVAVLWESVPAGVVAVAVALVLLAVVLVASLRRPARAREGWGGRGPFVMLSVAAGVAMLLSSAAVLGAVAFLERPGAPENAPVAAEVTDALARLAAEDRLREPVVVDAADTARLVTPEAYSGFAAASVVALAAFVLFVAALGLRAAALGRRTLPVVPGEAPPPHGTRADEAVQQARRRAALAQRAERIVGVLGLLFFLALAATLALPDADERPAGWLGDVWAFAVDWSGRAVVAALGLLVASVVLAGSKNALTRPWGLLWDLMCFLPRTAHPFAPPCYAERAVPELRSRIDAWLDGPPPAVGATAAGDGDGERERRVPADERRVVLSAHSLGGVVAVATLLARWDGASGPRDHRVALLTYGTQLRPYFGRFFPELLGPAVLGTRPVAAPRLWAVDPWLPKARPPAPPPGPTTLMESLTAPSGDRSRVLWRSLWRRTDFIGFPVDDYAATAVDVPASELDGQAYLLTVAAHGGYPATPEYAAALDAVLADLRAAEPAP